MKIVSPLLALLFCAACHASVGAPAAGIAAAAPAAEAPPRAPAAPATIPAAKGRLELDLDGVKIECFTYQPANWSGERMILVHHGVLRNASEYRDDSIVLGDRFGALIVAPRFDAERFPSRKYQRGGILNEDGSAAAPSERTYAFVPKIAAAMRALAARPALKYWIIGHSAGGQFAMRMSAFQDTGAERIVAANPGTDLFPTRDMDFGYGFGKLPESLSNDESLRRYLAAPLTLYLGTADDHPDEDLDVSADGMKQGAGRLQRGRTAFALGEKLAAEKGWPFAWKLVEAPGIEHDHTKMFEHAQCATALFGDAVGRSGKATAAIGGTSGQ
jgi:pimeloyl-ACP methyl ester carboxylesterase